MQFVLFVERMNMIKQLYLCSSYLFSCQRSRADLEVSIGVVLVVVVVVVVLEPLPLLSE